MTARSLALAAAAVGAAPAAAQDSATVTPPYRNESLPFAERARDLVSRMTLEEKVSQMRDVAPAIPRLGVPAYNWWNEALHGVARAGLATVFPQAIGIAATWDDSAVHRLARVISDEARAKYNEALRQDDHSRYHGLTFWSPNINIFRDPRWGRGQETYGEDPFLSGRLATQFIHGLQGDDPKYLETVSTVKHFDVHSGPEPGRHTFDARPSERDLHETYLAQFRAGIEQGGAYSLMCAYNRVYGKPACASDLLLGQVLRGEWTFPGYVVSDCDAIADIYRTHKYAATAAEAAADAVEAGTDLDCGRTFDSLTVAVHQGLIGEAQIDTSVTRLFLARMKLGMFDDPAHVPYSSIPYSDVDDAAHRALALDVARESMVLLKNAHHALPLRTTLHTIAVVGPDADNGEVLLGNYNGTPADTITPLRGIRDAVGPRARVLYARGSVLAEGLRSDSLVDQDALLAAAVDTARRADAVVLVLGLSPRLEGEEMRIQIPGFSGGDRTDITLPAPQERLMERIVALGKPAVLVLVNGSAVAVNWAQAHVPAILESWYGGQAAGTAIADVLFGRYNPGGRLPVTFYKSVNDLPPFDDYDMANRTYRFFTGTPLYPFGFGLSYTTFKYSNLRVSKMLLAPSDTAAVSVDVRNTGRMAGDEVVQLYVHHDGTRVAEPREDLRGFARVHLVPGERRTVTMPLAASSLAHWDSTTHAWRLETERVELRVGGSSADIRARTTVNVQGTPDAR